MYESRKIMGDVCEDVSSSIKERKDVLSEEQQHDRDSEPRQNEAELHLSDAVGLDLKDYVIRELYKAFSKQGVSFKIHRSSTIPELVIEMKYWYDMNHVCVRFSYFELSKMISPNKYIVSVCIQKFEETLKGVMK